MVMAAKLSNPTTRRPNKPFEYTSGRSQLKAEAAAPLPELGLYPRELDTVRFLVVTHLVMSYCYELFGGRIFGNSMLENFASWGVSQYSSLIALEGMILAIRCKNAGSRQISVSHDITVHYFVYLVGCVSMWMYRYVVEGTNNLSKLFLEGSMIDAWMPSNTDVIREPTWFMATLLFCYVLFPAFFDLMQHAENQTLAGMMAGFYACTTFSALVCVGFDLDMSLNFDNYSFTLATSFPLFHVASFLFGIALGLMTVSATGVRSIVPNALSCVLATFCGAGLLAFFLNVALFKGSMLVWVYQGMLLPVMGVFFVALALGKDAFLCPVMRVQPFAESLGAIALTMLVMQRIFINVLSSIIDLYPTVFWNCLWVSLIVMSFFIHRCFLYITFRYLGVLPNETRISANKEDYINQVAREITQEQEASIENPVSGWIWRDTFMMKVLRLALYYSAMVITIYGYVAMAMNFDWQGFYSVRNDPIMDAVVNFLKYCGILSLPSLAFSLIGHILYPPVLRIKHQSLETLIKNFEHKVYFRIVTRGKHPNLVRRNVEMADAVLRNTLPYNKYVLEVATDNPIDLANSCPGMATELLVPNSYAPPGGAKFKARALQFAIENSTARSCDWIVHLDEETRFDSETVRGVLAHCLQQDREIADGIKRFGNIGQGVILYGTMDADNWLTTLADSVRVGDDFGKFRLQYELHEPLIGMHGSFVVCQNLVEQTVTFDHGMEGSITEDAYFALVAQVLGVKFSWIDSFMFEQSPFSVNDFMHQRCRWFAGLWLIVLSPNIPLMNRITLGFFMVTWSMTPLVWVAMTLCILVASNVDPVFRAIVGVISGLSAWGYIVGFFFTFKFNKGVIRTLVLLAMQILLLPVFAIMELSGVFLGIVNPPTQGFHIVQKESSTLVATMKARQQQFSNKVDYSA